MISLILVEIVGIAGIREGYIKERVEIIERREEIEECLVIYKREGGEAGGEGVVGECRGEVIREIGKRVEIEYEIKRSESIVFNLGSVERKEIEKKDNSVVVRGNGEWLPIFYKEIEGVEIIKSRERSYYNVGGFCTLSKAGSVCKVIDKEGEDVLTIFMKY